MPGPFLETEPLRVEALHASVASPSHGAVVTFVGVVRDHHAGRTVTGLRYSAYREMAERLCAEIVAAAEGSGGARVALRHRIGDLSVGETAVVVVAAAAHRDAAFAACRAVIEAVKSQVPIWKHEQYADGSTSWVGPASGDGA